MKKIVITMLVLLSAAYAVGIGGGEVARKLDLRPGAEHRIDYYLFSQQPGDGLRSGRYGAGDGT